MEIVLGPGDIVLDGTHLPPKKRGDSSPHFLAHVLWPNGWMDQDATWYGVHIVLSCCSVLKSNYFKEF